jgi:hypothetical protein
MNGIKKVLVLALFALAGAAWAGECVSVPVLGEYTDPGTGHRMLCTGTVDFAWTPGTDGERAPGWAFAGGISIEVMDSSTGARHHYLGGCTDRVPVAEGASVHIERPVWQFGCACAPQFTGVFVLDLEVPEAAKTPVANVVAFLGR